MRFGKRCVVSWLVLGVFSPSLYAITHHRQALESCIRSMMDTDSIWVDLFPTSLKPMPKGLSLSELEILASLPSPDVVRHIDHTYTPREVEDALRKITGPLTSLFVTHFPCSLPYGSSRQRVLFERGESIYLSVNYFNYREISDENPDSLIVRVLPSLEIVATTPSFQGHRFGLYEPQGTKPLFEGETNAEGWIRFTAPQRETMYRLEYLGWNDY